MAAVALTADFVEKIHDELVGTHFPGVEPVSAGDARDRSALDWALAAPFATACGEDAFPTIYEKAARRFYGIAAYHPFSNGDRRTALVAADLFAMRISTAWIQAGGPIFWRRPWHPGALAVLSGPQVADRLSG